MFRRPITIFVFAIAVAGPAAAEVMDKEASVPELWASFGWGLLFCAVATLLWRWLLLPSYYLGIGHTLAFAWTEWFNPYVGPAMRAEAGYTHGAHILAAISLLLLAHQIAWFTSSRWSIVARLVSPSSATSKTELGKTLAFAIGLAVLVFLDTTVGFGASAWIWLSPPALLAFAFPMVVSYFYFRGRSAAPTVV